MLLNLLLVDEFRVEDMLQRSFTERHSLREMMKRKSEYKNIKQQLDEIVDSKSSRFLIDCEVCANQLPNYFKLCQNYAHVRTELMAGIFAKANISKILSPGRVIIFSQGPYRNCVGLLLKYSGKGENLHLDILVPEKMEEKDKPNADSEESRQIIDVALNGDALQKFEAVKEQIADKSLEEKSFSPCVISLSSIKNLTGITVKHLKISIDMITEDFSRRQEPKFR